MEHNNYNSQDNIIVVLTPKYAKSCPACSDF